MTNGTKAAVYLAAIVLSAQILQASAQELYPVKLPTETWHGQQRELRYKPDGSDFVITNGKRLFTRALYGTHTAFRVEAGDRPEFSMYMPGMGGNLKFGISRGGKSLWLTQAQTIEARYRPGAMIYTVQDPILGTGKLHIEILALADAEGLIIKYNMEGLKALVDIYWAFGGATGKKFSRDGDMGPDPESSYYLKPENCKDNKYVLDKGTFTLKYGSGQVAGPDGRYFVEDAKTSVKPAVEQTLIGVFDPAATVKTADATKLNTPTELYSASAEKAPIVTGKMTISNGNANYFALQNPASKPAPTYADLPRVYQQAETARAELAGRIKVHTPDPYINTIGGALAVASDGIWEAPSYMHGAVGWRMRLDGWRGPYTADALGWHDRAKTHFEAYAKSQVTTPASGPVIADTAMNLSRSLEKLGFGMFTSGYISRDPDGKNLRAHHYDMNLVYIDELIRHYEWTGDVAFIKQTWPVLKRHLEWEIRNFDADGNGLYDAYAAIWASDALEYSGGDVTHTSAYNYIANKRAAQIAAIVGEDPTPYKKQAYKILDAMNKLLWMTKQGYYAEFKDRLGNQIQHPSAALWTIYHAIDSEVPDNFQAYQSLRYVDNQIPHIPIKATGLDNGNYYTLSTTNWMPYQWSLNNVVLAESMHTALANWQGGRTDEAFKLFKSEILASMYMGGSPGNIVQISYYDAIRGESYRDFGDPIGMFSRSLVEGLFGIVPDALTKTLTIRPGLPSDWNFASFTTPDISFDFKRTGQTDNYTLIPKLETKMELNLNVIARGQVKSVIINGKPIAWKNVADAVGKPVISIKAGPSSQYKISIVWSGEKPALPSAEKTFIAGNEIGVDIPGVKVLKVFDPENAFTGMRNTATKFSARISTAPGNYTAFVQVNQGKLTWWMPLCFKVANPVTLISEKGLEADNNSFRIQNNTYENALLVVKVNGFQKPLSIPARETSNMITVPADQLISGTNKVDITRVNGLHVYEKLINWQATTHNKLEMIDLTDAFNDKVTQIFKNKYLSPRPTSTTLQLPVQGIGDWPKPTEVFNVDDSGLRKLAGDKNRINLPQGIIFSTPGEAGKSNIMFTSQWDNYPHEKSIALSGKASHAWFLMAGSTNPMQSQMDNGEILVQYTDGTKDTLALRNPETWWPIDQDYYTDGFAFALRQARPPRIHLATGEIVSGDMSKQKYNGKSIKGGAATVLDMSLDPTKTLRSLTLKTVANDVVIGLMAVTLSRE